jgi:peptide/nickel transport system substrate-binding protein
MQNPKFEDERVRMAIMHAIDVPSIMQAAYFDVADPPPASSRPA